MTTKSTKTATKATSTEAPATDEDLFADEVAPAMDGEDVEDLLSDLEAGAPAWVPETPGEGIQGVVTDMEEQPDEYDDEGVKTVPVVTLRVASGERFRVIGFGSVLTKEIRKANPEIGDVMAVKYFGKRQVERGRWAGKDYKLFAVRVKKGSAPA